jgi:hypothetical protein
MSDLKTTVKMVCRSCDRFQHMTGEEWTKLPDRMCAYCNTPMTVIKVSTVFIILDRERG